ncbi:AAA family ATPase [Singulisphaera sp. Ch08]|uniref:AAA family ATPase n=1 Tax=Singulisphaera sp. Ch08 TaxID=3120278 RepID=A0AAU7CF52_9BACT
MAMKDGIRILFVDPHEESRRSLLAQFEQMDPIWLAEVCVAYSVAAKRATAIQPEVTIVVTDADQEKAAKLIRTLTEKNPESMVLAATHSTDTRTVVNLVKCGVSEIVTLPISNESLLKTIRSLSRREGVLAPAPLPVVAPLQVQAPPTHAHQKTKTIVITGASGEVGCTSLAVNLAAALARVPGREVAIVDFDLMFGAVDTLLDVLPENTLLEIVKCVDRLDATLLKRMLCQHASGLYVLPRPHDLIDAAKLTPESLPGTLKLLQSTFSSVVIDTSKSLQTSDFVAFDTADVILVVTQLELTSVKNTARLLDCFRNFEGLSQRVQIVANRVGSLRSTVSAQKAEEYFKLPIRWQIPNATKVFHTARDRGVPIDVIAPRSEAQRVILQLANALVPSLATVETKPQRGFFRDRFQREG